MLNPNIISLKLKQGRLNEAFDKIYAKTVVVIIVLILLILKLVLLLDYTIDVFKNYMAVSYDEDDHLHI